MDKPYEHQFYPSTRFHPTEPRRTVANPEEDRALTDAGGWRDRPYSKKEREQLGHGPRKLPKAPRRNDFKDPDAFHAAIGEYRMQMEEYEYSLVED